MFQVVLSWRNLPSTPKTFFVMVGIQIVDCCFARLIVWVILPFLAHCSLASLIHIPSRGGSWTEQALPPFHILEWPGKGILSNRASWDADLKMTQMGWYTASIPLLPIQERWQDFVLASSTTAKFDDQNRVRCARGSRSFWGGVFSSVTPPYTTSRDSTSQR